MPNSGKVGAFTFVPITENGNKAVIVTADPHTGRLSRSASCVCKADAWPVGEEFTATQAGKPEFFSFDTTSKNISHEGGLVPFAGNSNAKVITGTFPDGAANNGLKASSQSITSGTDIPGDPGAISQYTLESSINVSENVEVITRVLVVKLAGETSEVELMITQAGAPAYVDIDKTEFIIEADGSGDDILSVTSNTDWFIEEIV